MEEKSVKIRIYVVDDEWMAIKYFQYLLERTDLEYELAGQATNSMKALKEIVSLKPDAVFMDINMPVLDGLELSRKILEQIPVKIFLLTSYRDFDFVKKGMQIGVADYILKNELNEKELERVLKKASSELYVEKKKKHLILEHNVRSFLLSETDSVEDHVYEHRPMQRYALISIMGQPGIYLRHVEKEPKPNGDCYELHNLAYPEGIECSAFTEMESGELCGVFFIHGNVTDGQVLLLQCGKLITAYLEERGMNSCCLISDTKYHFFELQGAYRELKQLSEYIYAKPQQNVFVMCDMPNKEDQSYVWDGNMEILDKCLEKQEKNEAEAFLEGLFFRWKKCLKFWEYTENLQSVYRYLKNYVRKKNLSAAIMEIPGSYPNTCQAEEKLKNCLGQILEELAQENKQNYSMYVQQAITYIHRNYGQDISIPDIAEDVGISEGHLRRLFKQELNMKVVDYLMEYRLESAKLLMKNTDENLTEIWNKTGFTSAQYFSYVFKRKEGMLPKEYLKKIRNE